MKIKKKYSEQQKKLFRIGFISIDSGKICLLIVIWLLPIMMLRAGSFNQDRNVYTSSDWLKQSKAGLTIQNTEEDTLHLHFISGSEEYRSENSLKELKQILEQNFMHVKVTSSWGRDGGEELPNIELLAEADLMLIFTRRMTLPEDQLSYILNHIKAEKPVIGIRPASHAFQNFLELDARVFGGDYDGHGEDESVELIIAKNAEGHPILKGVQPWTRPGKIYHNPELGSDTQVLLFGKGLESNICEPLAWTNTFGEVGRAFYTSMGLPTDFENENFQRMLFNAISWTTSRELNQKPN